MNENQDPIIRTLIYFPVIRGNLSRVSIHSLDGDRDYENISFLPTHFYVSQYRIFGYFRE